MDDIFDKHYDTKLIPYIKGWLDCYYAKVGCEGFLSSKQLIKEILGNTHWSSAWRDKKLRHRTAIKVVTSCFHILAEGDYTHIVDWKNDGACNVAARVCGIKEWLIIYEEDEDGEEYILYDEANGGWKEDEE